MDRDALDIVTGSAVHRLTGTYDGATVTHRSDLRVQVDIWVRAGKACERVTLVLTKAAYEDLQYVMDRGPLMSKTLHQSMAQKVGVAYARGRSSATA